jgi:response regulator RpfG family c-di-GMP phosphodiesterase
VLSITKRLPNQITVNTFCYSFIITFTNANVNLQYEKKHTKILLVDDEPDILEIVGYNLNQEGYQIFTAANGKEAIAKAKKGIDLIIMDVMMPEMDGMEV